MHYIYIYIYTYIYTYIHISHNSPIHPSIHAKANEGVIRVRELERTRGHQGKGT